MARIAHLFGTIEWHTAGGGDDTMVGDGDNTHEITRVRSRMLLRAALGLRLGLRGQRRSGRSRRLLFGFAQVFDFIDLFFDCDFSDGISLTSCIVSYCGARSGRVSLFLIASNLPAGVFGSSIPHTFDDSVDDGLRITFNAQVNDAWFEYDSAM